MNYNTNTNEKSYLKILLTHASNNAAYSEGVANYAYISLRLYANSYAYNARHMFYHKMFPLIHPYKFIAPTCTTTFNFVSMTNTSLTFTSTNNCLHCWY